jgi:hypothetical protein|tara:strand:+ start:2685 stop:2873 length:189 start_codon:yes stop_codon:yes gene_type:complete
MADNKETNKSYFIEIQDGDEVYTGENITAKNREEAELKAMILFGFLLSDDAEIITFEETKIH